MDYLGVERFMWRFKVVRNGAIEAPLTKGTKWGPVESFRCSEQGLGGEAW